MADQSGSRKRKHEAEDDEDNRRQDKTSCPNPPNDGEWHQTEEPQGASQENNIEVDQSSIDVLHINKLKILVGLTHANIYNINEQIEKLIKPEFGFIERLKRGTKNIELTEMLIKTMAAACSATDKDLLVALLNHANGSKFFQSDIPSYLNQLVKASEDIESKTEILKDIVRILYLLSSIFPRNSLQMVTLALASIKYIQKSKNVDISTDGLEDKLTNARKCIQQSIPTRDEEQVERCLTSVDDFRWLSTSPTCEDVTGGGDPYLRKNKIFGRYMDVNDYLDVHFRLLREDLIRPLREGLSELLEIRKEAKNTKAKSRCGLRVYQQVEFISSRIADSGFVYRIRFDTSRLRHIRWSAGKRLMYGSLVCLSKDNFKTMLFGTIAERKVTDLVQGMTCLSFDDGRGQSSDIRFHGFYEMIESPAYYEPYRNVLSVLQNLTDTTFPFKRYLLNHSIEDTAPPKYLTGRRILYDFSCLIYHNNRLDPWEFLKSYEKQAQVLQKKLWPSAERLGLDASQYSALKSALTTEFAVIQGPPGTGKTYIGVIIVQMLLANRYRFQQISNTFERHKLWEGPIMIVCYTNHALDQFLEEIFERIFINNYFNTSSGKIVRVGGRCTNEYLQNCNLSRFISRSKHAWPNAELLKERWMRAAAFIELAREEILGVQYLLEYIGIHSETLFRNRKHNGCSILLEWLDDGIGNSWISTYMLRNKEPEKSVGDDIEFEECDEWADDRAAGKDLEDLLGSEEDFQIVKAQVRESKFLKESPLNQRQCKRLQSLRHIRKTFSEKRLCSYYTNVWALSYKDRWRLYNYWVSLAVYEKQMELRQTFQEYEEERLIWENEKMRQKIRALKHAEVIAMTTTGASKNSEILRHVKPKIVIVEEAAEVLESHVVTSLTKECEHLILIGDHLQLRPKPSDHVLGKRYRLQVSLFERMLLNGKHYDTLTIQHRMRPEISKLLVPHIYKTLDNHQKVEQYEDIAGVLGNVFFVNHSSPERSVDDIKSHSNEHEAKFLAQFCKYLLNVGYNGSAITVLTAYTGQLFLLKEHLQMKDVRVTAIDNYQGEENDIILLSLVRSNTKNQAGFLNISNRICVALSRARRGLYIVGNADLFRDASPLWRDILDSLSQDGRLVDKMPLGCRKHPQQVTYVKDADDFAAVPPYGCPLPCDYRLDCGHTCERKCHPFDQNHNDYKCRKLCEKENSSCPEKHTCQKLCFEFCGPCEVVVERILPQCGHEVKVNCFEREGYFRCPKPCKKTCELGHPCMKMCYAVCGACEEPMKRILDSCQHEVTIPCYMTRLLHTFRCPVEVERTLTRCGHTVLIPCSKSPDLHRCEEPCKKDCPSGHRCPKKCHEDCGLCQEKVIKTLTSCQHKVELPCHQSEENYLCQFKCKKTCSLGHPCRKLCHEPCGNCEFVVLKTMPQCGHKVKLPCFKVPTEFRCNKPCKRVCALQHKCPLACGEDCGICHVEVPINFQKCGHLGKRECYKELNEVICKRSCEKRLSCGHICQEICGADNCTVQCKVKVEKRLPCGHCESISCFEYQGQSVEARCNGDAIVEVPLKETSVKNAGETLHHTEADHQKSQDDVQEIGCLNKCKAKFSCGHLCAKICQDCYKSEKRHEVCDAPCSKYRRLCSHKCNRTCGHPKESNETCDKPCTVVCPHSSISHKCGDEYLACSEPCKWNCLHYSCGRPCWSPCERPPCNEPCRKFLKCGHNCVGLCGEPCPPICRICDGRRFSGIEKRLNIKLTEQTKFLFLQPCYHVIECEYMDRWVKRRMKSIPYRFQISNFLKCPVCKRRVANCPRYNNQIKRNELHLNMAKRRIKNSRDLLDSISASLTNSVLGTDLNVNIEDKTYRLGVFYICYMTRNLPQCLPVSDQLDASIQYLSQIERKFQVPVDSSEDKEISSFDILNLYRIYIELYAFQLKGSIATILPTDRFYKAHLVLETCENTLKQLPFLNTDSENPNKMWKDIKKVNEMICETNFPDKKKNRDIGNCISCLNRAFDLELNANYNSHWFCCTEGHVYSCKEDQSDHDIDKNCSDCNPMTLLLLQSLKCNREKYVGETKSKAEAREKLTIPERSKGFHFRLNESDSNNSNPNTDKQTKTNGERSIEAHSSKQTFSTDERTSSSRQKPKPHDSRYEDTRISSEGRRKSPRKRSAYEQDYDGRRNERERDGGRKKARTDGSRNSYAENEDLNSSDFAILYTRSPEYHRTENEARRFREEFRRSHKEHSTYRRRHDDHRNNSPHPRIHCDGSTGTPWGSTTEYHTRGSQDFDGRRYYENYDRPRYDRPYWT